MSVNARPATRPDQTRPSGGGFSRVESVREVDKMGWKESFLVQRNESLS
jgi:hypothetical protein